MAELTPIAVTKAGIANIETGLVAAASGGDSVKAASGLMIVVANGDVSPHTLTVSAPTSSENSPNFGELPVADLTLAVAADSVGAIAIPPGYATLGNFNWSYDDVTSVTVGVYSIAP